MSSAPSTGAAHDQRRQRLAATADIHSGGVRAVLPVDPLPDQTPGLLDQVERSTARFSASVSELDAAELEAPSLLAGWSRRTIAAHLAFVATAYQRMTVDVLAGRHAKTYPGGGAERERSLRSLDHLLPAEVCERLRRASADLLAQWRGIDRLGWGRSLNGEPVGQMALSRLIALRSTELEVHHVDLGTGYTIGSWPADFVATCLPLRIAWLGSHHRSRPDADLGIHGRWLLRATDLGQAWQVEASGRTARCEAAAPDERADAVLAAPAADLFAFLLGREPSQPLELTGDEEFAVAFKRAFPGP